MDYSAVIFVFIIAISTSQTRHQVGHFVVYDDFSPGKYKQFQVTTTERWIWGFVDVVVPPQVQPQFQPQVQPRVQPYNLTRQDIEATSTERDPCVNVNPETPDFRAPGRRISQTKCYEYIWEQKFRHDDEKRIAKCVEKSWIEVHGHKFAIGGRDTIPGEFPHMAAIGWKASIGTWIFKCGSSLISPKFVLTAAHCSRASDRDTTIEDPVPKIVRLGDKNILDVWNNGVYPTDVKISNIIVHPQYAAPKQYYDIALMELENTVKFTKTIQPACLWNNFDTSSLGKEATLTGWGVVETASKTTSPELQAAVVDVIDSETCDRLLKSSHNRNWCGVQEHQICGGKLAGGVDACQGDSGGPLQVKIDTPITNEGTMHHIIGVTSFGIGCALPNLPGIYTRVSSFLDWIEPIVWP